MATTVHEQVETSRVRPMALRAGAPLAVALLVVAAGYLWVSGSGGGGGVAAVPTFVVEEGPLTISVTETGTIQSREQVILKNEVEGQTTILYLIPEGSQVKKGDLLVELDASELEDERIEEQIRVQNAEADWIRARENLEVVKNQAQADVAKATLDYRFAQEDLKVYQEGEYPKQLKELESRIALAQQELQRATREWEGSQILYAEKYISETELQADELAARKAQLDLDLAKDELSLLQTHTHQRRLDELNAQVEQMRMALERAERKAAADVLQAEADLRAKEAQYQQQKDRLEKVLTQLAKTKIYAPRDGLVVYATSTRASWRGNDEPLEEGRQVREREELIYLPTADSMMAAVKIQEACLDIVATGMPVRIRVDAIPGRTFVGRVARIAPLPDASSVFMNPDLKVYDTEIHLLESDPALRTGMNCTVDIVAAHYDKATYVPVQAVVRQGSEPSVYVKSAEGFVPRPVKLGLDNNRLVRIVEGLAAGDIVSLAPPLEAAGAEPLQVPPVPVEEGLASTGPRVEQESAAPVITQAGPANAEAPGEGGEARGGEGRGRRGGPRDGQADGQRSRGSPEQAQAWRERMQNMTPEQREQMRGQSRQRRPQNSAEAAQ